MLRKAAFCVVEGKLSQGKRVWPCPAPSVAVLCGSVSAAVCREAVLLLP